MARKAAPTATSLEFRSGEDFAGVDPVWIVVECAKHHFENIEKIKAGIPPINGKEFYRPAIPSCKAPKIYFSSYCGCEWGPQAMVLINPADEILLGGARGGSKTESTRIWTTRGNQAWCDPQEHPIDSAGQPIHLWQSIGGGMKICPYCVNKSYLNHPMYRVLIVRQNEKDLSDYLRRCTMLYTRMGADVTEKPARVRWKWGKGWGAEFLFGHMADASSFEAFQGQEFQRMVFEELTQIGAQLLYDQITASCRSTFTCYKNCEPGKCLCGALRPQILCTSNPNGKGHHWVSKLFPVKKPNVFQENSKGIVRCYVPAKITDNPYLMRDDAYRRRLESLPEPLRSAWLLGDWTALAGLYFRGWRPEGPRRNAEGALVEPEYAKHVIDPVPLEPYWHRTIGGDWGYRHKAAFYWLVQNEAERRLHVYDELVVRRAGPDEVGAQVAKQSLPAIEGLPDHHINVFLGHDSFNKRDDRRTIAEQFRFGVQQVLGKDSAFIMYYNEDEDNLREKDPERAWDRVEKRHKELAGKTCLTIHRAQKTSIDGWQFLRRLVRFTDVIDQPKPNMEYAMSLLALPDGDEKYLDYMRPFRALGQALPGIRFWRHCKYIIKAMGEAVHEEGTDDILKDDLHPRDELDGLQYTVVGHVEATAKMPKSVFVRQHMAKHGAAHKSLYDKSLMHVAAEAAYLRLNPKQEALTIPRFGGRGSDGEGDLSLPVN
jgi:hypothetical protein